MEKKWYIVYNGQQTGPMDKYELLSSAASACSIST